jgi:3-hydroxyisobutyrate dehydrogenase-like beta-hydroxyacid dehydrogenase
VVLADPPVVRFVLDQIESKLGPGQLIIQSSTISSKWTLRFAEQAQRTERCFWEAPFTGSNSRRNCALTAE